MAFIDKTKANYSFKVIQGKSHTANDRELSNESISSGIILSADRIFGDSINTIPGDISNVNIVSDLITMIIKPIAGSDGQNLGTWAGYRCFIDNIVPPTLIGVINPITGLAYLPNDPVGNIIPQSYGDGFRPILYEDPSLSVEIPPSDASDWFLDPFAGVITQEADDISNMFKTSTSLSGPHNGRLTSYIYIGDYVIDKLGVGTASPSEIITQDMTPTFDTGITGSYVVGTFSKISNGDIFIFLNGVSQIIGSTTSSSWFISGDNGNNARVNKDALLGDELYVNINSLGYKIGISDEDFIEIKYQSDI